MQVEWTTLKEVAATGALDVWILFPLAVAVNRLLTRNPDRMPEPWRRRLDAVFGTDGWYERFYRGETQPGLFSDLPESRKSANLRQIAAYYRERLASLFKAVAPGSATLYNSSGSPLYELFFAMANPSPKAQAVAMRILNRITKV